jgi:hypothetical protein
MDSRERISAALQYKKSDRIPVDFGGTPVTGINAGIVYLLRQKIGLDPPGTPVKLIEPYQMLGEIKEDLIDYLGIDTIGLKKQYNFFGFKNDGWKEWDGYHRVLLLVPKDFNTFPNEKGEIYIYPEGDISSGPSGVLPKDGWYFDLIVRQNEINDDKLRIEDNLEESTEISNKKVEYLSNEVKRLFDTTDKAIIANFGGTSIGDIAHIPGPGLKNPKGIRDIAEWYMSISTRKKFVMEIFDRQVNLAINNWDKIYKEVGNRITAVLISGADFGMQTNTLISKDTYREMFLPFHKEVNDWVHKKTKWKTFLHTCGSIEILIDDFIEAGFDILNPIQTSAAGMDMKKLKEKYGRRIIFWGGGVDTQNILPFGNPEDVKKDVTRRLKVFSQNGGFVFNAIHNIQSRVPIENILAMFEALNDFNRKEI